MTGNIYIDIHTHHDSPDRADTIAIRNVAIQEAPNAVPGQYRYSVGLHPWDTGLVDFKPDFMNNLLGYPGYVAVGECGLDRMRGADMTNQARLFREQALMAEKHGKPVIIHCVQAWQEIIAARKSIRPDVAWIIHGFQGRPELADQLIHNGFFLSFGESILKENGAAARSLANIPSDRFFLETDVSSRLIGEIYLATARIKRLSLTELQNSLLRNFEKAFGIHGTSRMA